MTSGYYLSPRVSSAFVEAPSQVELNIVMSIRSSGSSIPEWAAGLKRVGSYFEGYAVEDIETVRLIHCVNLWDEEI